MISNMPFSINQIDEARKEAIRLQSPHIQLQVRAAQLDELKDKLSKLQEVNRSLRLLVTREAGDVLMGQAIGELKQMGVDSIHTTLRLDPQQTEQTIHELHFLRECSSHYLDLEWSLEKTTPLPCERLVHMIPPKHAGSPDETWALRWKNSYSIEGLRYRRGPNMILIRDQRLTGEGQIIQLEDPEEIKLFWLTREPKHIKDICAKVTPINFDTLFDLQLLVQVGDWVMNLVTPANRKVIPYV